MRTRTNPARERFGDGGEGAILVEEDGDEEDEGSSRLPTFRIVKLLLTVRGSKLEEVDVVDPEHRFQTNVDRHPAPVDYEKATRKHGRLGTQTYLQS